MASLKVISASLSTPPRQRLKLQTTQLISFDSKYVSGEALEVLTSTTENKYIIKGSTGIGGTTAILNYQKGNYIIISPNTGMIKGKEARADNYDSDKQLFIFKKTKGTWAKALDYFESSDKQNLIINTTPNQILKIYDSPIYMKLIDIPIFIDEAHAYSQDATYRDSMGAFMELVYNEWNACFTLSTASPIYNFWDIPSNKQIQLYKVSRTNQQPKHLDISYDKKAINQFVYDQYEKGKLVVVFTNNKNLHTSFEDLRVSNLVGETLKLKLAPNGRGMELEQLDLDKTDVLILSSSYFAGFDIDKECSILIVSDQNNDAHKINVNNVVQCYGRCRTTVHQALFVNICNKNVEHPTHPSQLEDGYRDFQRKITEYESLKQNPTFKQLAKDGGYIVVGDYVNRMKLMKELIVKIDDYHLYNNEVLKQSLEAYGFVTSLYVNESDKIYKSIGTTFSEQMQNLIHSGADKLLEDYYTIKYKLRNKEDGTFSPKLALKYLTAYLITQTNTPSLTDKLNNNRVYAGEFYKSVNLFLCVNGSTKYHINKLSKKQLNASEIYFDQEISNVLNTKSKLTDDWQMLYTIHQISNNQFPEKVARGLLIQEVFNNEELYLKYKDSGKNKFLNLKNAILKELKEVTLDANEIDRLNKTIKDNYNKLSENKSIAKYNSNRYLKKIMVQAIIFCLTNGKCGKGKRVGFREYNPLTALPNALRSIIPIKFVEVDLTEANPQFIDAILKTNLAQNVYKKIMKKRGVTRYEAKQIFNSTLNNHRLTSNDAIMVYKDAGYSSSKSNELATLTTNVEKGSFFKLMTQAESELIHAYNSIIDGVGMRFHDALVFKASDIIDNNIVLPTNISVNKQDEDGFTDGTIDSSAYLRVHFHVGYYNAPELKYEGFITSKEYNSEQLTLPKRAS